MHVKRHVEIMVGFLFLLGMGALIFLAFKVSSLKHYVRQSASYLVTAEFDNIGGLKERAPVRLAGVRVGQVVKVVLNPKTYRAKVTLALNHVVHLPVDSSLRILTEGLLGSNYIALEPGYADDCLSEGGRIEETYSALVLENLIGRFLYRSEQGKENHKQKNKQADYEDRK